MFFGVALAARSASAQDEKWSVDVGGFIGGVQQDQKGPHELGKSSPDRDDQFPGGRLQPKQFGFLMGLRAGVNLPVAKVWKIVPSLEMEASLSPTSAKLPAVNQNMNYWWGLVNVNLGIPLMEDRLTPFILAGAGLVRLTSDEPTPGGGGANGGDTAPALDFGFGAKYQLLKDKPLSARLDLRYIIDDPHGSGSKRGTDDFQAQLGVAYTFGKKKVEVIEPPKDTDGDGVTDDKDKCPNTLKGDKVDANGCSLPKDSDGDGVMDDKDQCPGTPPGDKVDEKGCSLPKDSDGDGVMDDKDQCPGTPPGTKVDEKGCPLPPPPPDRDGDGVLDANDKCPDVPGPAEYDGCPPDKYLEGTFEGITFKSGKAILLPEAFPILDKIAKVMKDNPQIRVEVSGHTDNKGKAPRNLALSKARANAVKKYLTKKKIAAKRIVALGLGQTKPKFPNDSDENRTKNRRIDFKVLPAAPVKEKKGKKGKKGAAGEKAGAEKAKKPAKPAKGAN